MAREPTPSQVIAFWDAMQARYGTRLIDKSRAPEMQLVAWFLQRLGVLDAASFLERFTTTIGRRIYAPFTPGTPTPRHSLWSQIVTCVHEHQHVEQQDRDGAIAFALRYLASRSARAAYETDAYRCNLELDHWHTGAVRNPRDLAERLRSYGLRDADIDVAEAILIAAARTVEAGGLVTPATKVAVTWLQRHAPELAHRMNP
jgi:hypothetical protein